MGEPLNIGEPQYICMTEISEKWICKVCGNVSTPLANCTLERGISAETPHMCPWQSFDKKGDKNTIPAKWERA
jgi:hypothetical protein